MRENKFRAWIDGTMVRQSCVDMIPPFEYPLMQFTGLRDKNGKEIYEGDIATTLLNEDGFIKQLFAVVSIQEGLGIEMKRFKETVVANVTLAIGESTEMEVIGNIYENPELLKEN